MLPRKKEKVFSSHTVGPVVMNIRLDYKAARISFKATLWEDTGCLCDRRLEGLSQILFYIIYTILSKLLMVK